MAIKFEMVQTDMYGEEVGRRVEQLSESVVAALCNEVVASLWKLMEGRRQSGVMVDGRFIGVKVEVGRQATSCIFMFSTRTKNYDSFSAHCLYAVRLALDVKCSMVGTQLDDFCQVDVALGIDAARTVIDAYGLR